MRHRRSFANADGTDRCRVHPGLHRRARRRVRPTYVLYDGKEVYTLSDQRTPERFAGKRVTVTGTLDARTKTIQVDSIAAAK
ncbi:MAG: hypothetical protein LAP38_13755 [Acidobacteriia bacterium]|nr:hypothetical protein [Terriglobia bacterium]